MAELLSINDKLSDLMMTDINVTELRTDLRPHERGESLAQRQLKQPGNASESLSAMYSGAKKYLVSHQLCKFSHLKR